MLVEERNKCYTARDAYFACLDATPSASAAKRVLRSLRGEYEAACPSSWVKHFDKKREEDNKLNKLLQANPQIADSLPPRFSKSSTPVPPAPPTKGAATAA
mmetsp:Transcript_14458/g.34874  ORF Transcript_14458/g.34874 Transcript_14458/m.34874 type:complete len:101 (+) Transcript_14458:243-545(+)